MSFGAKAALLSIMAVMLTLDLALGKSIDSSDLEDFPKAQFEISGDDLPLDNALFKYILAREILSRQRNGFDPEEHQRKRNYWKQCAFNAVSCFGKK